jgi:hypothetical protein
MDGDQINDGGQLDAVDEVLRKRGIDPAVFANLPGVSLTGGQPAGVPPNSMMNPVKPVNLKPAATAPSLSFASARSVAVPKPAPPGSAPRLSFMDRGVQNALAAGRTPPTTDVGKAIEASGFHDAVQKREENDQAQGDTPQFADIAANSARMFAAARASAGQSAAQPRSAEDEFRDTLKKEPTRDQFPAEKMPIWKKVAGALASVVAGAGGGPNLGGETARRFFGGPERKAEKKYERARQEWQDRLGAVEKEGTFLERVMRARKEAADAERTKPEKSENLDREAYDYYVSQGMTPADARKRVLQDAQDVKPDRPTHSSPFEAFAYGDPQEKKAAQDYLEFEKKMGARYQRPSEFDERYRLFKEDPETYKALFGDKSGDRPDRATATRMLNYFDRRRREVQGDFTLDDQQKAQQLQDIGNLEKPFMDVVQPGGTGGNEDRVTVTHPDGRVGTIPRSQVEKAKKKGFKVSQ